MYCNQYIGQHILLDSKPWLIQYIYCNKEVIDRIQTPPGKPDSDQLYFQVLVACSSTSPDGAVLMSSANGLEWGGGTSTLYSKQDMAESDDLRNSLHHYMLFH